MPEQEVPGPALVRDFVSMGQVRTHVQNTLEVLRDASSEERARKLTIAIGAMELTDDERRKMRWSVDADYISAPERARLTAALSNPAIRALLERIGFEMTPIDSFLEKLRINASREIAISIEACLEESTHRCGELKKQVASLESAVATLSSK